ncbi:orf162 (mitochondrion) [Beta vulgaris subsp. vulgaris]|uniref:Orf162 protein n=3 Tax=Beta TaxID=3554 RepID=Q9MFA7_BETVV|nr:orf162 [Beta vulgaris subsp. vulgaris]YP_004222275.1 hypothetical protein LKY74_mgp128 [Beta vulgaris subsp. maritima]YP_004842082.1 hypothetical protein LKY79_mgp126 [Beta macrocarpa]CBJ14098.1 hypothetical protein [Beta vulgaris subsp. maritima]CBJ17507.1 hypothetical protein [Beta vulgaris subsp. maritima]CBJ23360.1 hypothetical protein [Beta vulgaris subsp. maritima]CBL52046.1 hypothetical protein [Beta vulgaris subsp. maritima]CBX24884.1 hypothetical protein [Beta macrocarpa]
MKYYDADNWPGLKRKPSDKMKSFDLDDISIIFLGISIKGARVLSIISRVNDECLPLFMKVCKVVLLLGVDNDVFTKEEDEADDAEELLVVLSYKERFSIPFLILKTSKLSTEDIALNRIDLFIIFFIQQRYIYHTAIEDMSTKLDYGTRTPKMEIGELLTTL